METVKIGAEVMAIIVAGGWAIFGFIMLKQRTRSSAELKKIELESRKIELQSLQIEHQSRRLAIVNVSIDSSVYADKTPPGFGILANVAIENIGTRDTRMVWEGEPAPFSVRRVDFDVGGCPIFGDAIELRVRRTGDPDVDATSLVVRAGATEHKTFAVHVEHSGLYLLSFRASMDHEAHKISEQAGAHRPTTWTATHYLLVRERA